MSFKDNIQKSNYWGAAADGLGVVADGILVVVPGAPGVVGLSMQAGKSGDEMVTLYRGVDDASPAIDDALEGVAKPRGGPKGHTDANAHSEGFTETSAFTSWTSNKDVAKEFATNDAGTGVVLTKQFKLSDLVQPSSPFEPSELEYLIKGDVVGAKVERVE